MKKILLPLLLCLAVFASVDASANPFIEGKPAAANAWAMNMFATPFLQQVLMIQRQIHEAMTDSISALQSGQSMTALWWLLLISFGYGVFHVLAPGHGKVIVASYFLGNRAHWLEGVWAGLIMAVGHTVTAIGIVVVLYFLLGLTQFHVLAHARYMELLGYGLICAIGLWMLFRAFKNSAGCASCGYNHGPDQAHDHNHDHNHSHAHHHDAAHQPHARHEHGHDHHGHDHAHHPHTHDPKRGRSLFAVTSLVPCSGSMIILLFTVANNVLWAGILAVIAIALGMWLMVTLIGFASMLMRHFILGKEEQLSGARLKVMKIMGVAAALVVLITGGLLFIGTLYSMGSGTA